MIQPALCKCFPLIFAIPPGFLIPAYFIIGEFVFTSRAMMKMLNSTESKIHPNTTSMAFAKHRWHGFILFCFMSSRQIWLDCSPYASTILCPMFLSVNGSHLGPKVQRCPWSECYTRRSIQRENNLRNKVKPNSHPIHIFTPVQWGLSVGNHVISSWNHRR